MRHYSEDELILFFYDEIRRRPAVERHLDTCSECAARYSEITATLRLLPAIEAPERGERYGLEVWQRIRPVLPTQPPAPVFAFWSWQRAVLGGAVAVTIVAAFLVGRAWPAPETTPVQEIAVSAPATDASDLVRVAAIADHLDESERLLLDFVNAGGQVVDVSGQQATAADLVDANRLYRDAAIGAGDVIVADVLDSLERNLMEIVHGPSTVSPAEFNKMRMRLDAAALLFKVRVLSDELHEREVSTVTIRRET